MGVWGKVAGGIEAKNDGRALCMVMHMICMVGSRKEERNCILLVVGFYKGFCVGLLWNTSRLMEGGKLKKSKQKGRIDSILSFLSLSPTSIPIPTLHINIPAHTATAPPQNVHYYIQSHPP